MAEIKEGSSRRPGELNTDKEAGFRMRSKRWRRLREGGSARPPGGCVGSPAQAPSPLPPGGCVPLTGVGCQPSEGFLQVPRSPLILSDLSLDGNSGA